MRISAGLVICLIFCSTVSGAELPSLERGAELFGSKELGSTGKSCSTCHPGGKGLEETGSMGDEELADTINGCIRGPLQGKQLDEDSVDMKSFVLYLKSLGKAGKQN